MTAYPQATRMAKMGNTSYINEINDILQHLDEYTAEAGPNAQYCEHHNAYLAKYRAKAAEIEDYADERITDWETD